MPLTFLYDEYIDRPKLSEQKKTIWVFSSCPPQVESEQKNETRENLKFEEFLYGKPLKDQTRHCSVVLSSIYNMKKMWATFFGRQKLHVKKFFIFLISGLSFKLIECGGFFTCNFYWSQLMHIFRHFQHIFINFLIIKNSDGSSKMLVQIW